MTSAARSRSRSAARLAAVQALYQQEMERTPTARLLKEFHDHRLGATIEDETYHEAEIDFFDDIVTGVEARRADIDDPHAFFGFVNPPVVHASTVLFPDAATMASRAQKYTYGTRGTPTTDALAGAIDMLEGSAGTIVVPSGLAAVTIPLLAFLSAGDHVLVVDSVYSPTRNFCNGMLKRLGIAVE